MESSATLSSSPSTVILKFEGKSRPTIVTGFGSRSPSIIEQVLTGLRPFQRVMVGRR